LTIVILVLALIGVPVLTAFLILVLYRGNLQKYRAAVFAAVVGLIFMVFIAYQDWHSGILPSVPDLGKPSATGTALIQAALVVGAGTIVAVAAVRATSNILNLVAESEDRYWVILLSFLTVSAAAVIAAFMLTIPSNPPLPKVVIDVKEKKENTTGRLLTHAEGFWYIFEEKDDQPGKRLTAIPDDEVTSAWVSKVPAR